MGFLENIFYKEYKTPETKPNLDLSLDKGTLGCLHIGDRLNRILTTLGPADRWWDAKFHGCYYYTRWGVVVEVGGERIDGFTVAPREPQECGFPCRIDTYSPYNGLIRLKSDAEPIMAGDIDEKTAIAVLGEPFRRDAEEPDQEIVLLYRGDYFEYDLEFTWDGRLKCIRVWPSE